MKSSIALLAALTPLLLAHSATVRFIQTKDEALEYACPGNWFLSSTNRPLPMLGRVPTASDSGRFSTSGAATTASVAGVRRM